MSVTSTEHYIRLAKEQLSQRDINDSLVKAISQLILEVKRLEEEVHRARRDAQVGRRFQS